MTILKSIIEKIERKLMKKYLQFLIKDLCYLEYRLDAKFYNNKFIHNKLINVYQDILTNKYAYFKLAKTLASLINNLHSSIIIF